MVLCVELGPCSYQSFGDVCHLGFEGREGVCFRLHRVPIVLLDVVHHVGKRTADAIEGQVLSVGLRTQIDPSGDEGA